MIEKLVNKLRVKIIGVMRMVSLLLIVLSFSCKKDKCICEVNADFESNETIISEGDTVVFKDLTTGDPERWDWQFKGGTFFTSTDQSPVVVFSEGGVYDVELVVSNSLNTSSATKQIIVMPKKHLVAYYPFNGNAKDETGNGHDGITRGSMSSTSDRFGNEDSAFEFDGINDLINTSSVFDFERRAVSLWVNPYDVSGFETNVKVVITQDDDDLEYGILRVNFQEGVLELRAGGTSGLYRQKGVFVNSWMHLVLIRDEMNTLYYINNELVYVGTSDASGSTWGPNANFIIGAGRSSMNQFFKGKIDDIRIFDRTLNEAEIAALFYGN